MEVTKKKDLVRLRVTNLAFQFVLKLLDLRYSAGFVRFSEDFDFHPRDLARFEDIDDGTFWMDLESLALRFENFEACLVPGYENLETNSLWLPFDKFQSCNSLSLRLEAGEDDPPACEQDCVILLESEVDCLDEHTLLPSLNHRVKLRSSSSSSGIRFTHSDFLPHFQPEKEKLEAGNFQLVVFSTSGNYSNTNLAKVRLSNEPTALDVHFEFDFPEFRTNFAKVRLVCLSRFAKMKQRYQLGGLLRNRGEEIKRHLCCGCHLEIPFGQAFHTVEGFAWHQACFRCARCCARFAFGEVKSRTLCGKETVSNPHARVLQSLDDHGNKTTFEDDWDALSPYLGSPLDDLQPQEPKVKVLDPTPILNKEEEVEPRKKSKISEKKKNYFELKAEEKARKLEKKKAAKAKAAAKKAQEDREAREKARLHTLLYELGGLIDRHEDSPFDRYLRKEVRQSVPEVSENELEDDFGGVEDVVTLKKKKKRSKNQFLPMFGPFLPAFYTTEMVCAKNKKQMQAYCRDCWIEIFAAKCPKCEGAVDKLGYCEQCAIRGLLSSADKCAHCKKALLPHENFSGNSLVVKNGEIHVECEQKYKEAKAVKCKFCGGPIVSGYRPDKFSGKKADLGKHGLVHMECKKAFTKKVLADKKKGIVSRAQSSKK